MRPINDTDKPHADARFIQVTGLNDHQMPNKQIIGCAAVSTDCTGQDVLGLYNKYANCPELTSSIHSALQLRAHGIRVEDVPKALGGGQRLVCQNGEHERIFPLVIENGLA